MKECILLTNQLVITHKDCFYKFKDRELFLGVSLNKGNVKFIVNDDYELYGYKCGEDEEGRYIRVNSIRWITTFDKTKEKEKKQLTEHYSPEKYPKYDNIEAINVDKSKDIPVDYDGLMGVPISYIDYFDYDMFEIVCNTNSFGLGVPYINGKAKFTRLLIKRKTLLNDD